MKNAQRPANAQENPDPYCWQEIRYSSGQTCEYLAQVGHCRNCRKFKEAARVLLEQEIPAGIRESWTRELACAKTQVAVERQALVVFRLHQEWFALPCKTFHSFTEVCPHHLVPFRSNEFFLGLVTVGGELLPLLSAAAILRVDPPVVAAAETQPNRSSPRLAVIGHGYDRFVFRVEETMGVVKIPSADIKPPPATVTHAPTAFTRGIFRLADCQVALLDEQRLQKTMREHLQR